MKTCNGCQQSKPIEAFGADGRAKDGRQGRCRDCVNAARRKRYHDNPEQARQRRKDYYKRNKDTVLSVNARSRAKNAESIKANKRAAYQKIKTDENYIERSLEYRARNKDRKREYDRKYRRENARRLAEIKASWREENRDLVRVIRHSYKARRRAQCKKGDSGRTIADWLQRQDKVCHWCNEPCSDFHIDHYIPLSRGGEHKTANMVIACPSCNVRKNAKMPEEFLKEVKCNEG